MDEMMLMSRRLLLGGSIAIGAATTFPAFAAGPQATVSAPGQMNIPDDTAQRVRTIRRVRLRTDPGLVFWYFQGRNYAQQGATLTPLCDLKLGSIAMVEPNGDGTMDVTQYELGYRASPGSRTPAEKLLNPITDEMVDTPIAPVGPVRLHYDADNALRLQGDMGSSSLSFEHVPELFYQAGDNVAFLAQTRSRVTTPGKPDRIVNDVTMFCSPASEALDPKVHCASAIAHGSDVTDFARWWKMPADVGTQALRSLGHKVERYAEMPEEWSAVLARVDPLMATDPLAGLKRKSAEYRN